MDIVVTGDAAGRKMVSSLAQLTEVIKVLHARIIFMML